jgi:Raf kinase inhibitor-like YbhB/YbcL family protein
MSGQVAIWRHLLPAILLVAAAGCGTKAKPVANFSLTSSAFQNGGAIPQQFTCDGGNNRPALHWSTPPSGTRSFALIVDDPDAPGGTFHHWGVYDIPGGLRALDAETLPGHSAISDVNKPGYFGPCPPKGEQPHHYRFKLYALDVSTLDVGADYRIRNVEAQGLKHRVGRAELVGIYQRR